MAIRVISTAVVGVGHAVQLGTQDDVIVTRNGVAASTGTFAGIYGIGSDQWVRVDGAVAGRQGIYLGNEPLIDVNNSIWVGQGGVVSGIDYGIITAARLTTIRNFGEITGDKAIQLGSGQAIASTILNHGVISGDYGIFVNGEDQLRLTNHGLIEGTLQAVTGSDGRDIIRNKGVIEGDIYLGFGNDAYDGRGGTIDGKIYGGAGDDGFIPGAAAEDIDGWTGEDALDFTRGGGIRVHLDNSAENTRNAEGDTYGLIEHVFGSIFAGDSLVGNIANNALRGYGGVDTLIGNAGDDSLIGGVLADSLTGGLGNDVFLFETLGDAGDVITDFGAVLGNDDVLRVSSAFGGGLTAGTLAASQFHTSTTAAAGDADDRFIFKTMDRTLWFDANGSGAGELTLLARFGAGVMLTAADILVF